mmetsp:Transcript_21347/g.36349  ORF Transcript_21347/g.36349 Transcript_21347/m.36349 type:complete len:364 (+) Transcript_21347:66-1157(+)|eukprot:CAMPEP_0119107892 /NCGR_PEP_ID=MMETSP1180-20130426/12238_1 /TAXON_ID=3052 ORGANISM="Chlamydomonas cf sp, Strain CCMP681" /NCGR_SAMPLE_ID=MMETSP1180 /ASSEMBLY_ACC=CAM_ASM_000741 /LENGTH=363 /DNA_ID=CAMNT_0007093441 /DNA_START=66 /DNA_END=1157 /DNA_ORIENTATION=-
MASSTSNKLEAPNTEDHGLVPFNWRTIGAVFALPTKLGKEPVALKLSGRCNFTARQGFDPIDKSTTGRVLEGNGDAGITLRKGSLAFVLSASNISYRSGLDDPLAAVQASVGEGSVPSLKFTLAKEYRPDSYAAISYDARQKKPEFALAWSGETFTEQAAVVVHADPLYRTYKLSASVAFPGPDWRDTLLDSSKGVLEEPKDDGARHRLWVKHTVKDRQLAYHSAVGAALDLGRVLNLAANWFDYKVEPHLPPGLWRIPLMPRLYDLLVPMEDDDQVRHHVRGWDLEATHQFGQPGVAVGLAKHARFATLRGLWNTGSQEAAVQYKRSGVSLTARIARQQPDASWRSWGSPSLHLSIEPLGLL